MYVTIITKNITKKTKIMKLIQIKSNIKNIFGQTFKRLRIFSITKKIILLIIFSYLAIGILFYQYTQKVSFPTLLANQEQQMDSIALFIQAEIEHIPELNSDNLNYIKRKMLENSHIFELIIFTRSVSVGKALPIKGNMHLDFLKKQPLLAKRYNFEDGYFIIYYKADQYVKEVNAILDTAFITFILMTLTLAVIAVVLKLTLLPFTQLAFVMKNINYDTPNTYTLPYVSSRDERHDLISAF